MSKKTTAKPTSARKLAANRANAQESTGPKTPEGKARSRCNAITHGLRATDVVLMNDPNEPPEEFDELRDSLSRDIQPANTVETLLVERLAVAHWRLRRAARHEASCTYGLRTRQETDPVRNLTRDLGLGHGADLPSQLPAAFDFDQLLRYEAALNRTISQIFRQLIQLRNASPRRSTTEPGRSSLFPATDDALRSSPNPEPPGLSKVEDRIPIPDPPSSSLIPASSSLIPSSISAQSNPTESPPESTQPSSTKDLPAADPPSPSGVAVRSSPSPEPRVPSPDPPIARRQWRPGREPRDEGLLADYVRRLLQTPMET